MTLPTLQIVEILPTRIWIENDICGGRHVVLQHEGCEPFTYASFNYSYAYTSNAGTSAAARELALSLGATEPIEQRHRGFPRIRWWHHTMAWLWMRYDAARRSIKRRAMK